VQEGELEDFAILRVIKEPPIQIFIVLESAAWIAGVLVGISMCGNDQIITLVHSSGKRITGALPGCCGSSAPHGHDFVTDDRIVFGVVPGKLDFHGCCEV
jgi:hypothetical protein